jgi:hypothetical protein
VIRLDNAHKLDLGCHARRQASAEAEYTAELVVDLTVFDAFTSLGSAWAPLGSETASNDDLVLTGTTGASWVIRDYAPGHD